jgi:hypothetical protein
MYVQKRHIAHKAIFQLVFKIPAGSFFYPFLLLFGNAECLHCREKVECHQDYETRCKTIEAESHPVHAATALYVGILLRFPGEHRAHKQSLKNKHKVIFLHQLLIVP